MTAEQGNDEVVRIQAPSLSMLNIGTGNRIYAEAVIAKLLLDTISYFGVVWSQTQITSCAEIWASDFYWMKIPEIKLFLLRLKTGQFTKDDWRHLSPFQLMGWLGEYAAELLVCRAEYQQEREAAERHQRERERLTNPDLMAFDAIKAFQAIGHDPTAAAKEKDDKEEIYRQEKIKQRRREYLRNNPQPNSNETDDTVL